MARRTGKEGIYTRVANKDKREALNKLESLEARLEALGFEPVSDEQRKENLENHLLFLVG